MAEATVVIAGSVLIDPPEALAGAVAVVRLRETALADAPSRTVASASIPCSGPAVARIPFRLAATVARGGDYSLAAEVRRDGGGRLRPGDLVTVAHHGWTAADAGEVELRVRPTG